MRLLLADDEPDILAPLEMALRREEFEVVTAGDGTRAWELFEEQRPDFAVLDVNMPGLDGITLVRQIRDAGDPYVPVILLTGRAEERHKIAGLDRGADDYVVKPCTPRELTARIRAIWRRARPAAPLLTVGDLTIDPAMHRFLIKGRQVAVTAQEFVLLSALVGQAGQVVRTAALMKHVWGAEVSHDLLRVTVYRLRRKIEPTPQKPRYLHTIPGVGFMIWDATVPAPDGSTPLRAAPA